MPPQDQSGAYDPQFQQPAYQVPGQAPSQQSNAVPDAFCPPPAQPGQPGQPEQPAYQPPGQGMPPQPPQASESPQVPQSPRRSALSRAMIVLIVLVVVASVVLGVLLVLYLMRSEKPAAKKAAPMVALNGFKESWKTTVPLNRTLNADAVSYAALNPDGKSLFVFAPADKGWTYTVVNASSGKPDAKKTSVELPACENGLDQPYMLQNGKPVCTDPADAGQFDANNNHAVSGKPTGSKPTGSKPSASKPAQSKPAQSEPAQSKPTESKPPASEPADGKPADGKGKDEGAAAQPGAKKPAFLPEHSVVIYSDDKLIIAAMPDASAAQAAVGYTPKGKLLWSVTFEKPGAVSTDGKKLWVVSQDKDGKQLGVAFYTPAKKAPPSPKVPEVKVVPKDFLKSFDFKNTYFPGTPKGTPPDACDKYENTRKAGTSPMRPIPSGDAECFVKVTNGRSQNEVDNSMFYPIYAVDEIDNIDYQDLNGDGYLDAVMTGGYWDSLGTYIALANPKDPDHPWIGLLYAAQGSPPEYQGNGVWLTDDPQGGTRFKISLKMEGKTPVIVRENR